MKPINRNCLHEAIRLKNVSGVREILLKKPELCKLCENNRYLPLWHAALNGCKKIVKILIEHGVNVDQKCLKIGNKYYGYTFLQYLSNCDYSFSNSKVAEVLVGAGADVNACNVKGKTPLRMAVENGNTQYAKFLLKNGAKLEGPGWNGKSPASYAFLCIEDDFICKEMLLLLLDHGLNANFRNENDENLLHTLIGYEEPRGRDGGIMELAEILLDAGVPINDTDNSGFSPLLCALNVCKIDLAAFLLRRGADVKMKNNRMLPLFYAVYTENENIIDLILKHGAEINAQDEWGKTALHNACYYKNEKIISLLVRRGADIKVLDENDETPLTLASRYNYQGGYDQIIRGMVEEFTKLYFNDATFFRKDTELIQSIPVAREHFNKCTHELNRMKRTQFYGTYSYYSVLQMSNNIRKLACLVKNEELATNFWTGLHMFSYYVNDLREIFEEAVLERGRRDEIEARLRTVLGDLFPDVVIRSLAKNLVLEDFRE